jgi:hypothetical protein
MRARISAVSATISRYFVGANGQTTIIMKVSLIAILLPENVCLVKLASWLLARDRPRSSPPNPEEPAKEPRDKRIVNERESPTRHARGDMGGNITLYVILH